MTFLAHDLSLTLIRHLRPLVERIPDRSLRDQIQRAASSVCLNLAESRGSRDGLRMARFRTALGSVREVRSALQVAVAWGWLDETRTQRADACADEVTAILWCLTRGAR